MGKDFIPYFFSILDIDREKAFKEFYLHVEPILRFNPPRQIYILAPEEREDCLQEVFIHFWKEGCSVLKKYLKKVEETGKEINFNGWFYITARNKIISYIRELNRLPDMFSLGDDSEGDGLPDKLTGRNNGTEKKMDLEKLIRIVGEIIIEMRIRCQMLLSMAASGLKPRDIASILAEDDNKKISNDLRYCRKKLKNLIHNRGVRLSDYLNNPDLF